MLLMIIGYLVCFGLSFYVFSRSIFKQFRKLTVMDLVVCAFMSSLGPVGLVIAAITIILENDRMGKLMKTVVYRKKEEE